MDNKKTNAWECECGNIEYRDYPPEECGKCWKINCFNKAELKEEEDILEELE